MNLLPHWYLAGIFGIFGLLFGSFLNVVIYRVPAKVSLMGRSACPKCGHMIRGYDNIPVFAWLFLRGKCRDCHNLISIRYPLIEAFHALGWVGLFQWTGLHPILPLLLVIFSITLALTMIDFDTLTLPDALVLPSWVIVAGGLTAIAFTNHGLHSLTRAGYSLLFWGGFYFCLWFFSGGRALGFGDVKLAPVLGALAGWFSWHSSLVGFFAAFIIGGIPGAILLATGILKRKTRVPYGPLIIIGAWVGIIWGTPLTNLYMHVSGLK